MEINGGKDDSLKTGHFESVIFGLIYKTIFSSTVYQTQIPDFLFKSSNPNLVVI